MAISLSESLSEYLSESLAESLSEWPLGKDDHGWNMHDPRVLLRCFLEDL